MTVPPATGHRRAWRARLAAYLHRQWQRRGWLACLLWPLAVVHGLVVRLRHLAYRRGWCRSADAPVPVLVVGNILVGGSGKTPLLMALIPELRALGWTPGVISRGYGAQPFGATEAPRLGQGQLDPDRFGDEPALIAGQTQVPLAIHPRRHRAALALCAAHPEIDLLVADDGLQHLALGRQLEVVVQDERGVGNGWLLPAGPLREPPSRLRHVAALVTNLAPDASPIATAPPGVRAVGMRLVPDLAVRLVDGARCSLAELARQTPADRLAAVAAIGQPTRFFTTLRAAGLTPAKCRGLPDHDRLDAAAFAGLDADVILITDKDAVKCQEIHDPRLWRVPVHAHFTDPGFVAWLSQRLQAFLPNSSSRHGSSTA